MEHDPLRDSVTAYANTLRLMEEAVALLKARKIAEAKAEYDKAGKWFERAMKG